MTGKFTLAALNLLTLLSLAPPPATAVSSVADARGRNLAAACNTCHLRGDASTGPIPRVHGRPTTELLDRLDAFRSGQAPATVMHQIARGYTRGELRLIADHLARQP